MTTIDPDSATGSSGITSLPGGEYPVTTEVLPLPPQEAARITSLPGGDYPVM